MVFTIPSLEDIDPTEVNWVSRLDEITAPSCATGSFDDVTVCGKKGCPIRGIHKKAPGDDQHESTLGLPIPTNPDSAGLPPADGSGTTSACRRRSYPADAKSRHRRSAHGAAWALFGRGSNAKSKQALASHGTCSRGAPPWRMQPGVDGTTLTRSASSTGDSGSALGYPPLSLPTRMAGIWKGTHR